MGTYDGGSPASCDAAFADADGHSSSSETWPSALMLPDEASDRYSRVRSRRKELKQPSPSWSPSIFPLGTGQDAGLSTSM